MVNNEVWNTSLMKLPENILFILLKNWLGEIETPYNKHKLITRLNKWLNEDSVKKEIVGNISEKEAELISFIIYSDGLTESEIFKCLEGSLNIMLLKEMLWNLKDRLILFTRNYKNCNLYQINPYLKEYIISHFNIPKLALPEVGLADSENSGNFIFSKTMINAFFSIAWENNNIYLSNGSIKKKWVNCINNIINNNAPITSNSISLFWNVMETIGITQQHGENISINITNFFELNKSKNFVLFILTKMFTSYPEDRIYNFFKMLIEITTPKKLYTKKDMLRWIYLILCRWFRGREIPDANHFFEILNEIQIIGSYNDNFYIEDNILSDVNEDSFILTPSSEIHISKNFKISTLLPFISIPEKLDNQNIYILNKKSIQLCMDCNISADEIKTFLEQETGTNLHQNLSVLIEEAEEEHKSLRVMEGVVLIADEEKQTIIDNSDFLKPYIISHPAPSVYILQPDVNDKWELALNSAGFNHVARFRNVKKNINLPFFREEKFETIESSNTTASELTKSNENKLSEIINKIDDQNIIDSNILRMNKKMILNKDQIDNIDYRQEIREAGGLDFNAKKRLIQSAIDSGKDRLELIVASRDTAKKIYTIYPDSIITEDENVMIQGRNYPDNTAFNFPIRKILRVRKIPVSITGDL